MKLLQWLVMTVMVGLAVPASAQITVPHTLADGETVDAARLNTNFSTLGSDACNRTACTMTGTLTARDIAAVANATYSIGTTGTRFVDLFLSGTLTAGTTTVSTNTAIGGTLAVTGAQTFTGATALNGAVDIAAGLQAGSGNVAILDATGRVPAISSTYFASLVGTNLTGVAMLASANTFSAKNNFLTYSETKTAPAIAGGSLTLNLDLGSHFVVSLNQNVNLAFSNPSSSAVAGSFTLAFTNDGTVRTVTWPGSVRWPAGLAPTMTGTLNKVDVFTFLSYDGGTNWYGFVGGQNF